MNKEEIIDLRDFANFLKQHSYPNQQYQRIKNSDACRNPDEIERIKNNIINWSNKILIEREGEKQKIDELNLGGVCHFLCLL